MLRSAAVSCCVRFCAIQLKALYPTGTLLLELNYSLPTLRTTTTYLLVESRAGL